MKTTPIISIFLFMQLLATGIAAQEINYEKLGNLLSEERLKSIDSRSAENFELAFIENLNTAEQKLIATASSINPRVVGGSPASIGIFYWQTALIDAKYQEPYREQFCGGTIISETQILTAAHCLDNPIVRKNPSRLEVVTGTEKYSQGGQRNKVVEILFHPKWNGNTMDYDAAILNLENRITSGKPISLSRNTPADSTDSWVSGWGATSEGGYGSIELLQAKVPIVDFNTCNSAPSYNGDLTNSMLCAGIRAGGVDACQGDSGGPLVIGINQNRPVLVGVVSWGIGCARREKYGVYSDVAVFHDWIIDNTTP